MKIHCLKDWVTSRLIVWGAVMPRRGKKRRQMKTERRIQIEAFKLPVLSLLTLFTLVCTMFTLLFLMPSCHLSSPFQSAFSSPLLYASTAPLHYFVSCLPAPLPAQLRWYKVWRQLLKTWGIKWSYFSTSGLTPQYLTRTHNTNTADDRVI